MLFAGSKGKQEIEPPAASCDRMDFWASPAPAARSWASTEGRRSSRQHEWVSKGLQAFGRRSPVFAWVSNFLGWQHDAVHPAAGVADAAGAAGDVVGDLQPDRADAGRSDRCDGGVESE